MKTIQKIQNLSLDMGVNTKSWAFLLFILFGIAAIAVWISIGDVFTLLLILGGLLVLSVVFMHPDWGLLLIPIAVTFPRVLPRFGNLGYTELVLGMLTGVFILRFLLIRQRVRWDLFFGLMIFIAGMIFLFGRGELATPRFYNWLGSCLAYFLVTNLVPEGKSTYSLLLGFSIIIVSLTLADFLVLSGPLPKNENEWALYRSLGSTLAAKSQDGGVLLAGQANFIANLATILFSVPLAYGFLTKKLTLRWLCLALIVGNIVLAILVQTRAFVLCASCSLLAMLFIARKQYGFKLILFAFVFLVVAGVAVGYFFPGGWERLGARFTTANESEARFAIWRDQISVGLRSPIWGHGAIGYEAMKDRFGIIGGHGLLQQLFFEYGLIIVLPVIALLACWFWRTLWLISKSWMVVTDFAIALANFGVLVGLLANAIINDYLLIIPTYSTLAFSAAGLLTVQMRYVRWREKTHAIGV